MDKEGKNAEDTEFKVLLKDMGMNGYQFHKWSGQAKCTVYDWLSGKYPCSPAVIKPLRELIDLRKKYETLKEDYASLLVKKNKNKE